MTNDKFLLLKMHGCCDGVSDEAVREIANECELVKCDSHECLHHSNELFESVYLLIHGRIKQSLIDIQGNVLTERFQTGGSQMGALAAALGEPSPIELVAEEPSTLLKLEYQKALELTSKHHKFRENFFRLVAMSIQNVLMKDRRQKKPTLVGIFHQSNETRQITRKLIERLKELGEHPCLLDDQVDGQPTDDIPYHCVIENGEYISENDVRHRINDWSDSKRVFIDLDAAIDIQLATNVVESCGKVLWCVTEENWNESISRLSEIEKRAPNWRDKINVVWLLPGNRSWGPLAPEFKGLAKREFKISFEEPPATQSRELINGLERIVHQLRGVRIGLALGGGAARGMAHLGVLKALEQNGIVVDMIAGTSAGAMTGVLYASGMDPDYNIESFVKDLKPSWLYRHLPSGGYWYLLHKYRRGKFDPMLRKYLKDSRLEQLAIPVHSVTVDLVQGQPVVRSEGDSVHAITESINLPVLSLPINRDGKALIDGGIVNNIPANVLVSQGCNFVIAVSVTSHMEHEFVSNRPDTPTSKMKKASAIKTMMRTYMVQNLNMNSVGVQPADFVIEPDVSSFDLAEFTRADEMAAIGESTTLESLSQLKLILNKLDDKLFPCEDGC